MPPLGNLYRIPVYVDHSVATSEFVAFNAGTHSTLIQMAAIDYLNLAKPTVARFTSAGH
jgi:Ala-tRNA(Pro) deacylase